MYELIFRFQLIGEMNDAMKEKSMVMDALLQLSNQIIRVMPFRK